MTPLSISTLKLYASLGCTGSFRTPPSCVESLVAVRVSLYLSEGLYVSSDSAPEDEDSDDIQS